MSKRIPEELKKTGGRKRLPDDQVRSRSVDVGFTPAEYEKLSGLVSALGYSSIPDLIRCATVRFLGSPGILGPEHYDTGDTTLRQCARLMVAGIVEPGKPKTEEEVKRALMPEPHPEDKKFERLIA